MKKNYLYLIKNVGILAIGNFTTKLLNFFLIPLYTAVLTTTEYGEFDLLNTTVGLFVPIFTLNIFEGIFRYALDQETDKAALLRLSLKYFLLSFVPLCLFAGVNLAFDIVPVFNTYLHYFLLIYAFNALSAILNSVAKGLENLKIIAFSGVLSSFVVIVSNILLLLVFQWGLSGYFLATVLGSATQCICIIFGIQIWRFRLTPSAKESQNRELEKKVVSYSKPLIANSIGWWVNNVSDRYTVTLFCGLAANGIYSIAYKIPTFLNVLTSIFNQAWNLSAIKDFDKDDKDGFFSETYTTYNCGVLFVCSVIILFNKLLARILYVNDFYVAWKYVPFLVIAFFFGALSGYLGAIFAAVERTDVYAKSTTAGAVINVVLNFILVYFIGAMGAAIATLISYFSVWVMRYYHMSKFIRLKVNLKRDLLAYAILVLQALGTISIGQAAYMYILQVLIVLVLVLMYAKDIGNTFKFLLLRVRGQK